MRNCPLERWWTWLSCTIHCSAPTHSVAELQETQGDQSSTGEGPSSVRSGEEGGSAEGRGPSSAEGECHIVVVLMLHAPTLIQFGVYKLLM